MRTLKTLLLASLVAFVCAGVPVGALGDTSRQRLAREIASPPGQIVVLTANARQARVLDLARFRRLLALVEAIRTRPPAFDGGSSGAITAPDAIMLQEMTGANVEIFRRLYNQRSDFRYEIVSTNDSNRTFLVNSQTITLNGEPQSWDNTCRDPNDPRGPSRFLRAPFVETETGFRFVMAGVHYPKKDPPNQEGCKERNTAELRNQLAGITDPIIVGGDFNKRPVQQWRECDPNEETAPFPWYATMTEPGDGGQVFVDAVRAWHRAHRVTMEQEWTHEFEEPKSLCDGRVGLQRSRIDYLFASGTQVAEAHADHPGWAGEEPGSRNPDALRYSDHRFVSGRFVVGTAPSMTRPTLEALTDGGVQVTWTPADGVSSYVVYRALRGREYSVLERLPATDTSFTDLTTRHDTSYRYAVAAIGADGSQGVESRPARIAIDARGPRMVGTTPAPGAVGVSRRVEPAIRFDERVAPESVSGSTMRLWRNGRRVAGRTIRVSARVLRFDPRRRLARRATYRVGVRPVEDRVGNRGPSHSWRFTTRR